MRVKTDAKRCAIIEAAAPLFWDHGFDRVSMAAISEAVGGSKATLYGYFSSKEELFMAVVEQFTEHQKMAAIEGLSDDRREIREVLSELAHHVANLISSRTVVAIQRAGLSVAALEAFGSSQYRNGPSAVWHEIARYLQRQMDKGALRQARSDVAAFQFKGLIEAGTAQPALYNAPFEFPLEVAAEAAVDTFMRAYAPEEPGDQPPR